MLESLPPKEIIAALKNIQSEHAVPRKNLLIFIKSSVCESCDITTSELMNSPKRGVLTTARKLCYMFMYQHMDLSYKDISSHFDKSKTAIAKAFRELNKESLVTDEEKDLYEKFKSIEDKILVYIQENKNK